VVLRGRRSGFKDNLSDVAASIGIHQLRKIDRFLDRRNELAARYDEGLAELPLRLPTATDGREQPTPGTCMSYRLDPGARLDRDELIAALYERRIGCSVHFIPLHHHPYWRDRYDLTPDQFPQSETMYGQAVSLPLFTRMTDADQDRVIVALQDLLGR